MTEKEERRRPENKQKASTTIFLPTDLKEQAQRYAKDTNHTFVWVVEQGLREILKKEKDEATTKREPNAFVADDKSKADALNLLIHYGSVVQAVEWLKYRIGKLGTFEAKHVQEAIDSLETSLNEFGSDVVTIHDIAYGWVKKKEEQMATEDPKTCETCRYLETVSCRSCTAYTPICLRDAIDGTPIAYSVDKEMSACSDYEPKE